MEFKGLPTVVLGISLFSISIVITLFVLIISFKLRFHKKFSTELIIYVFISEIIYALTRYPFLKQDTSKGTIMIILSINVYTESVTLISIVVHTVKIYDAIIRESQWFTKPLVRHSFRVFIFILSAIRTGILITIQYEIKQFEIKCNDLFCDLDWTLVLISIGIDFLLFAIMFIFILYSYCVLKKSLKNKQYYSVVVVNKIKKVTCKVWLFPIATFIYWCLKVMCQCLLNYDKDMPGLNVSSVIISGLKAAIYALLFVLTQDTLKNEIRRRICCYSKPKRTETMVSMDNEEREFEIIELTGDITEEEEDDLKI